MATILEHGITGKEPGVLTPLVQNQWEVLIMASNNERYMFSLLSVIQPDKGEGKFVVRFEGTNLTVLRDDLFNRTVHIILLIANADRKEAIQFINTDCMITSVDYSHHDYLAVTFSYEDLENERTTTKI